MNHRNVIDCTLQVLLVGKMQGCFWKDIVVFLNSLFFLSETTKIFTWINYWQVSSDSTHSRESCSLKAISSKFILKSTEIHVQSNMNLNKANFRSIYSKDSSEAFYLEFSVIFKLFYKYHQRKLKEVILILLIQRVQLLQFQFLQK